MRSSNPPSKLFVGDIGDNRKSDLNRLFSKYGEISTIYVDDNKHFAFVEFTSSSDAQRALQRTNNKTVNGSRLRVEYAKPDKTFRDNRRPLSRERSRPSAVYDHLQVTANRLPSMPTLRQSYYQHHPATMMTNSTLSSRGRSLTPPSFKQNPRLSSMNHLRPQDFYPPYYPHPALYTDPAYYRAYGDPYLMQRLPPPPFLPPASPPPSSSSRAYRNMHSSSDVDRYPPLMSHRRKKRSRSRSRRRSPTSRRNRSNREKKRKRRTSSSPQQRERSSPSSHRTKKRSRSSSKTTASTSEQNSSSTSSSEDEDKKSNSRKSQDNESNQKNSKTKTKE